MKLELKHLTPYLPYRLTGMTQKRLLVVEGINYKNELPIIWSEIEGNFKGIAQLPVYNKEFPNGSAGFKPILRPLSDLTKEVEIDNKKFIPKDYIEKSFNERFKPVLWDTWFEDIEEYRYSWPYGLIILLFQWHFDVFGLIDEGLAIDINTLKHD